jgi:hypothetical protein
MTDKSAPADLALIFTGHMVDTPDRDSPRFPPALEPSVTAAIREAVAAASGDAGGSLLGIASGARGGDILFLEACHGFGLPYVVVLPSEPVAFVVKSVRGVSSGDWEHRFGRVWAGAAERRVVPVPADANPYDVCNREMRKLALARARRQRLLALWDGGGGDGPGGTADFVRLVEEAGGEWRHLDTRPLLARLSG